jgi:hypothetical protein
MLFFKDVKRLRKGSQKHIFARPMFSFWFQLFLFVFVLLFSYCHWCCRFFMLPTRVRLCLSESTRRLVAARRRRVRVIRGQHHRVIRHCRGRPCRGRLPIQTQAIHGRIRFAQLPINVLDATRVLAKVHDDKVGGEETSGGTLFWLLVLCRVLLLVPLGAEVAAAAVAAVAVRIIVAAAAARVIVAPGRFGIRTFS